MSISEAWKECGGGMRVGGSGPWEAWPGHSRWSLAGSSPGSLGEGDVALTLGLPPGRPRARVRMRPAAHAGLKPQRAAAWELGPILAGGGDKAPLLPARSSRLRFWPCPLVLAGSIWLSLLWPSPRRLPPSFREGLFAMKTRVWGRSMWRAGPELLKFWDGSPGRVRGWPLPALARVRPRLLPTAAPEAGRSPSHISAHGEQKNSSRLGGR